jgi:hypothetical protein
MLFFFPLIHSIKFAQHDMQHTCSAQLSSWSPRTKMKIVGLF